MLCSLTSNSATPAALVLIVVPHTRNGGAADEYEVLGAQPATASRAAPEMPRRLATIVIAWGS